MGKSTIEAILRGYGAFALCSIAVFGIQPLSFLRSQLSNHEQLPFPLVL
jgi:hypothetical protein